MHKLYEIPSVVTNGFIRVQLDVKNTGGALRTLNAALLENSKLAGFVVVGSTKHDRREPLGSGDVFYFTESIRVALAAYDSAEPLWSSAMAPDTQS